MIAKIHQAEGKTILVIVDNELVGKKFEELNRRLDLTGDFYKGEEKTEEQVKSIANSAYIIHIVGEKSLRFAIRQRWVEPDNVIRIKNVPHAEVLMVEG